MSAENSKLLVYSKSWCKDCIQSKEVLREEHVDFDELDVELNPELLHKMREFNGGRNSVPTIVFPDGTVLVEPNNEALKEALLRLKKP